MHEYSLLKEQVFNDTQLIFVTLHAILAPSSCCLFSHISFCMMFVWFDPIFRMEFYLSDELFQSLLIRKSIRAVIQKSSFVLVSFLIMKKKLRKYSKFRKKTHTFTKRYNNLIIHSQIPRYVSYLYLDPYPQSQNTEKLIMNHEVKSQRFDMRDN